MMDSIRQYLLTITAAAIVCAIANMLAGKKGTCASVMKLLSGLFLALCAISPLLKLEDIDFGIIGNGFSLEAEQVSSYGEIMAKDAASEIINERIQAYILDKAASMDLDVAVEVTLDDDNPPKLCAVTITGAVSPYSKEILSQYIADNLSIAKEDQQWS